MHWLPDMVFLDLETTGATPLADRIIEIGLIKIERGEATEWKTFVNPGVPIPPFITQLTGITNTDVENAPSFEEVAPTLYGYLEGHVMAAHNARFDYGFLKAEYKRIGATLRQRTLCTVKLSRRLFPEHASHGLDAIIARHGLVTTARHRAIGDVQLMLDYLEAARGAVGSTRILETIAELIRGPSLPPGLDPAFLDEIPEGPGVYLFYGENDLPLYIGKSVNLRSRILNHFSGDHASEREMEIAQKVRRVEWLETAGEIGALLLESKLVKERQPAYNRMLRENEKFFSIRLWEALNQVPLVTIVDQDIIRPSYFEHLYGLFRTKAAANNALRALANEHQLCTKALGFETGKGACFAHQLQRCNGVCIGKEKPELHHLRIKQALLGLKLKAWPYESRIGIRESHSGSGLTHVHVFDQWCYLGTAEDEVQLDELRQTRAPAEFVLDDYKLLMKALDKASDVTLL
ncbi:MAG TPA: exonuclease domain-containing protein [Methylophilaceae bacterium]|nr:exonuclease domain-containing protein [Methylophilaceae bacterium]